jgi:hypothetical protein
VIGGSGRNGVIIGTRVCNHESHKTLKTHETSTLAPRAPSLADRARAPARVQDGGSVPYGAAAHFATIPSRAISQPRCALNDNLAAPGT